MDFHLKQHSQSTQNRFTPRLNWAVMYKLQKGFLKLESFIYDVFSDAYDSQELQLKAETIFKFDLLDSPINSSVKVEYLKGSFAKNYNELEVQNYGNIQFSIAPKLSIYSRRS